MAKWREFERLVARIYTELEPNAQVIHNDRILGVDGGIERQIDVSIRFSLAGHQLLVIVQAKDYHTAPADINDVGKFATVIRDVRASKGILICNAGFTDGAIRLAKNLHIDLCAAHDALSRDWKGDISIPVLWIDRSPKLTVNLLIRVEAGDSIPRNPQHWILSSDRGKTRLKVFETFVDRWNEDALPREPGYVHNILTGNKGVELLVGKGLWRPIESLSISYVVVQLAWLKYISPSDYRGIKDYLSGAFTASYLELGLRPFERDETWKPVEDLASLVVETKGTLITAENPVIRVEDAIEGETTFTWLEER